MLELGIFGFIFLTIAYWAVLFTVGRREDVLHGEFVTEGASTEARIRRFDRQQTSPPQPISRPPPPAMPLRLPESSDVRRERLESLLDTIKQDLSQMVPK